MKSMKNKFIRILSILFLLYMISCLVLFFFEPAELNEPDLKNYQHYFDSYLKFSKETNQECYIKQISINDISQANDKRVKYVDNTIIAITQNNYTYDDVASLLEPYNYEIVGMIPEADFYQICFNNENTFEELLNICKNLSDSDVFEIVIPDYFEETPAEESTQTATSLSGYYYELLNLYDAWELLSDSNNVNIGIIDFYVDNNNKYLNIINGNDYSSDKIYDEFRSGLYSNAISHGTHVAGIIGASHNSDAPGVINNANIYSYNGVNVSTSYWIASLYDMIVKNNIKVINVSMGYNPYITISAALGCENAIYHIESEKTFFSAFLSNIIDKGYEFVICSAAGNENDNTAYRIYNGYFGYGDKKVLDKLDIFGIFDKKPSNVDSSYAYFFSDAKNKIVSDRILVVGAIDKWGNYCNFSCTGNSVDIAAPGTNIYSTIIGDDYSYMTGTSMATPFVSGAAAMVFSVNPNLNGAQVKNILISSSTQTAITDEYSYPVLNIGNAVKEALSP